MVRVFTLATVAVGVCFLCSCVGKFSLIDEYYASPEEGKKVVVEEVPPSPELIESESMMEVTEEPLK